MDNAATRSVNVTRLSKPSASSDASVPDPEVMVNSSFDSGLSDAADRGAPTTWPTDLSIRPLHAHVSVSCVPTRAAPGRCNVRRTHSLCGGSGASHRQPTELFNSLDPATELWLAAGGGTDRSAADLLSWSPSPRSTRTLPSVRAARGWAHAGRRRVSAVECSAERSPSTHSVPPVAAPQVRAASTNRR